MFNEYLPPTLNRRGQFSTLRMHLRPVLPIPVSYATAAVPTFAPFGTEYTPQQHLKIVGGQRISVIPYIQHIPQYSFDSVYKKL